MAATRASRLMKSICRARMPKSRLRSVTELGMADHLRARGLAAGALQCGQVPVDCDSRRCCNSTGIRRRLGRRLDFGLGGAIAKLVLVYSNLHAQNEVLNHRDKEDPA